MQRIGNLNWENITYDHDISGLVRGLTDWGVIEGGTVVGNKLQPVQAIVPLVRSNGQKILAFFESDEVIDLPTIGDYKVYIEVDQDKIDFGGNNAEDGTGIASIKTWPSVPSQNFLLLATVADWQIKDERNLIPKIQSVAQKTATLEEKLTTADGQISQLVEAGTPRYLGITGIVWEKYTMEDTLFLQKTPTLADSTIAINVGDTAANKEQHIQRIASGTTSNQLKLKLKKFWAPTTSVVVEVRKWVKVDVSDKEAYRYGREVIATTTIAYTQFTTDWKEFTLTLNNQFGGTKGELLDIVVYQQGGIVNWTNYYQIACDSTQYSEAFSYVSIYNNNRERGYLMPYCISEVFEDSLLCKTISTSLKSKSDTYQSPEETRRVYRWNDATLWAYNVNNILSQTPVWDIDISLTTTWDYWYTYNRVTVNDVVAMSAPDQKTFNWIKVKQWDVIKFQSRYDMSQSSIYMNSQYNTITATYNYLHENYKTIKKVVWFSNELKLIWSYWSFVFFWLKDWEFYNWLSEIINTNSETSTTATTWTIVPWNFVWYFKLWKYRVPFYTE